MKTNKTHVEIVVLVIGCLATIGGTVLIVDRLGWAVWIGLFLLLLGNNISIRKTK